MSLHLAEGTAPEQVLTQLRDVLNGAKRVANTGGGVPLDVYLNDYLSWVSTAESQLQTLFADSGPVEALHSDAYWYIRELSYASPRAYELIINEVNRQIRRLERLRDEVGRFNDFLTAADGTLVLLDTNVLLQFLPPEQVKWETVVGTKPVRLVLVLPVVDELDEKKYLGRPEIRDVAREVIRHMRKLLIPGVGAPVELPNGVTIEVPAYAEPTPRTRDTDLEVLLLARDFKRTGAPTVLVTGDAGMQLRGLAIGVNTIQMPERYLRKPGPKTTERRSR